jgi:AraC family transcriptional regulator
MLDLSVMAQALDFVEDHLREDIKISDIAQAVSYSVFYFCRIFNQVTHHTPYDYLMRRRVAESARELLQTDKKIIDIAGDYQFNNPETFSRAFKRVFDMQPNQWRKQGRLDRWRIMPRLTLAHLEQIARGSYLKPVLVEREALQLAGLMTIVQDDAAPMIDLRKWLAAEMTQTQHSTACDLYEMTYYLGDGQERGFEYMLGFPFKDGDAIHRAWVIKRLPAQKYARFIHQGLRLDLILTLDYAYHTWLPQTESQLAAPLVITQYRQGCDDSNTA